ncbi:Imm74 family immunity protein [Anaerocolumna sp. AGMB13020]|uniref:Imm74 family immunity protein n=1 Tax=Anaerocolumna sp. AGMB13020 TaxID=3081750 RepID=UPI002954D331|nr:Imm74 family immunity protein [Anaerocolumna sp. AGMB13020]WOO36601.1 Imm74 family immunity protein [Anaerocolumna sp. AGMB13020]
MKITGSMNYIKFDLENGYVMKAEGEMLVGKKFVVYRDTMKVWEAPHEKEEVLDTQIENIIQEVKRNTNENTVQIIFN